MHIAMAVLLGVGLSASTGLNTFLPLLLLATAERFGIAGITLGERFEWLSSDVSIGVLIVATLAEVVGDKFPAVDHLLDSAGTFVRPVAGAVATASVLTGIDPTIAAVVGIIVGAPTSLGLHTLKAGTRVASSATTFGCGNPLLSLVEDILSFALSVVAIFAPIVVPVALALLVAAFWLLLRRIRRQPPSPA